MFFDHAFWVLCLALIFEYLWGDPRSSWHPVACFGRFANLLEILLWKNNRHMGYIAWLITIALPLSLIMGIFYVSESSENTWLAILLQALLLWSSLGWKSLLEHVHAVANSTSLHEKKKRVSHIVGRKTNDMDEQDAHRAAIESLAENTSDSIIAPLFWFLLFGALGAWLYRMMNTLDAMWGYKTQRHHHFGWCAAKADDIANWIPARLTALFMLIQQPSSFSKQIHQQAKQHSSPNAGFPETAMAFMLRIQLGGPVRRAESIEQRAWMGNHRHNISNAHIQQGCQISHNCAAIMALCVAIITLWIQP